MAESVWDTVEIRDYDEETKLIAGKEEKLGSLSAEDVEIFVRELDRFVAVEQHPIIRRIVAEQAPNILDVIRAVQYETKAGFKGAYARGNELTLLLATPTDFGWASDSWLKTWSSTGAQDWVGSSSSTIDTGERGGHVWLALIDPIEVPKIGAVKLTKDGDGYVPEVLSLGIFHNQNYIPVHQLREPWLFPPRHTYYVQVRVDITGDDKLQPIAFIIDEARDVMSL